MQITVNHDNDAVLIVIDEGVLQEAHLKDLKSKIFHFLEQGRIRFVLDMTGMRSLDSPALATLVACRLKARKQGGDLILANIPESIMSLVGITYLTPWFTIAKTTEEAIASFKKQTGKA